jgi:hypothetical protein
MKVCKEKTNMNKRFKKLIMIKYNKKLIGKSSKSGGKSLKTSQKVFTI